ncbi:MAG: hypothetical protein MR998_12255, partial [Lachnospiraceae bacterium]|nr:hypothetical protein [Lachnospiraceae bacterium]
PYVTFDEAFDQFQQFYNTDIFPSTQRTFAEVDESIAPLDERMTSSPSIATEEFVVRVFTSNVQPTVKQVYQDGRALHDVYMQKQMQNQLGVQEENTLSLKERILLPALASALYDISQTMYVTPYDNIDYSFTSYKTAEIYITLTNAGWADAEQKLHFLLIAEARLLSAEETYPPDRHPQDDSKQKPLLYYYLAKVKHDLIGYCNPVEDSAFIEELKEGCCFYSKKYLAEPNGDPQFEIYCKRWLQEYDADENIQSTSRQ